MVGIFLGGIVLSGVLFTITPQGFLPTEDQSLLYVLVTLPTSASLDQTTAVVHKLEQIMIKMPQVEAVTSGIGFGFANSSCEPGDAFRPAHPFRNATAWRAARSACSTISTIGSKRLRA